MQPTRGRGKHTRSGAWAIHSRRTDRGLDAVKLVQDLDQPFNQALVSAYWPCCSSCAPMRRSPESMQSSARAREQVPGTLLSRLGRHLSQLCARPGATRLRSTSGICAAQSPNSKPRAPDCVCRIISHCLPKSMRKLGALRRGSPASRRRWQKRARTTSAGGTRNYIGCEVSYCSCSGADAADVEAAFLRAIEIARSQQARSLELRATMSLARLCEHAESCR